MFVLIVLKHSIEIISKKAFLVFLRCELNVITKLFANG